MTKKEEYDAAAQLERLYKSTWLCKDCGARNSFELSLCPRCEEIEESFNRSWLCE